MYPRNNLNLLTHKITTVHFESKQVALLWQRDRATRLSVEILQLQNIAIIICVILRLAVFTQYRSVTDTPTQTDGRTDGPIHDDGMYCA